MLNISHSSYRIPQANHIVLGRQKEDNSFQKRKGQKSELKLLEVQCSNVAFKLLQIVLERMNDASALKIIK